VLLSKELLDDFEGAPDKRQLEITKVLISASRDEKKPDIVRQNAVEALRSIKRTIRKSARAQIGQYMQELLKGAPLGLADMKIAAAAELVPYLKQSRVKEFFEDSHAKFVQVGCRWTSNVQHRKLLDDFEDVGGLEVVPPEIRSKCVLWMVRCFIGEPGGYGMGYNRNVFYSDVAAPRIREAFQRAGVLIHGDLEQAAKDKLVKAAVTDKHIARRMEMLRDLVSADTSA
jgi:hypothetical protein